MKHSDLLPDRWKFSVKQVEGAHKLVADPIPEAMSDWIGAATRELMRQVHNNEEQMILESTPTPTLEILHKRIGRILESRKNGTETGTPNR